MNHPKGLHHTADQSHPNARGANYPGPRPNRPNPSPNHSNPRLKHPKPSPNHLNRLSFQQKASGCFKRFVVLEEKKHANTLKHRDAKTLKNTDTKNTKTVTKTRPETAKKTRSQTRELAIHKVHI